MKPADIVFYLFAFAATFIGVLLGAWMATL